MPKHILFICKSCNAKSESPTNWILNSGFCILFKSAIASAKFSPTSTQTQVAHLPLKV